MSKAKRLLSAAAALAMTLVFSAGALAASYNAASWSDLAAAFADTSGEDVSINLTADIAFNSTLEAKTGVNYEIGTANGSKLISADFNGEGSVEINADIIGGLETVGDVTVTVNGDVENTAGNGAVVAGGNSSVTVNGDVRANDNRYSTPGVKATDNSSVTVNGDVTGKSGVVAAQNSTVTVDGNVYGGDGEQSEVDMSSSVDYADGGTGVDASGNAVVSVSGNVSGGNAYGCRGEAGHAIYAKDSSNVTVGGNATGGSVTANPSVTATGYSAGGDGIHMKNGATVTVGGNATGGSSNGDKGRAGCGAYVGFTQVDTAGSLTVGGCVTSGKVSAENGQSANDIQLTKDAGSAVSDANCKFPTLKVGAYNSIGVKDFNDNAAAEKALLGGLIVTGLPSEAAEPDFWQELHWTISKANKGDTITVNAAGRTVLPAYIMDAVREYGVILVIEWDGGENIVIDKPCEIEEGREYFLLSELAELYKK